MGARILIGLLAVALAGALVVIAYLLGQRSAVPQTAMTVASTRAVVIEREAPIAIANEEREPQKVPPEDPELAIERKDGQVAIVTPKANADDKKSWELSQYFAKVHALQVGPAGTSAQGFAQEMLGDTLNGNTSGIEDLLKQSKDAERKAKDLKAPAGAETYQRQLVDLLSESTRLLAAERDALVNKDTSQLMSLASTAKALEQKAKALEAEEQRLTQ